MKSLLLLSLLVFGFIGASAQRERYVKFVDEAKKDASFFAFRKKLIAAAKRRDAKFILSILDKDVRNSRNGTDGIEEFRDDWRIESPDSKFWAEFLKVITNGGKFVQNGGENGKYFTAPFSFDDFPDDLDSFEYHVIFGSKVNLRAKPEPGAPIAGKLSYNIVRITDTVKDKRDPQKDAWHKIETLGGKTGFVKAEFVRSPIDYRAGFIKQNGKWKMIYFTVGD